MPRALSLWILVALLAPAAAWAEQQPPIKPAQAAPSVPAGPSECATRLKASAVFTPLPAIHGPGECGADDLVKLESVLMPDRSRVMLVPPATMRCPMAEAVTEFVRTEVGPAAAELGAKLAAVTTAASYDCRNRNGLPAAKISEHARANALDIGAVRLANRTTHSLTNLAVPESFRSRIRDAACQYFTTVLGPGSDAYHNEHIHLDRAERNRGYRLCQWNLGPLPPVSAAMPPPVMVNVPLPSPKPVALREMQRK